MASDITFDIPHSLGAAEAKRRIERGLPKLAQHIPGGGTLESSWTGDHLAMAVTAMGQRIAVDLAVGETSIAGRVRVPMMLSMMSGPISEFLRTSAQKMLDKP